LKKAFALGLATASFLALVRFETDVFTSNASAVLRSGSWMAALIFAHNSLAAAAVGAGMSFYTALIDALPEKFKRREVQVPSRSWLTRMSFFLLSQVVESGGGTAKCLESLTNFVNQVVRVKAETKASMRLYQLLSLFTPIALSFITALMFTLLTAFSATLLSGAEAGMLGEIAQIPQALVDQCYMLVIASSVCVALLSAKAVDLTAKNTLWITVNLAIAAGGIAFSTQIAGLLFKIIGVA